MKTLRKTLQSLETSRETGGQTMIIINFKDFQHDCVKYGHNSVDHLYWIIKGMDVKKLLSILDDSAKNLYRKLMMNRYVFVYVIGLLNNFNNCKLIDMQSSEFELRIQEKIFKGSHYLEGVLGFIIQVHFQGHILFQITIKYEDMLTFQEFPEDDWPDKLPSEIMFAREAFQYWPTFREKCRGRLEHRITRHVHSEDMIEIAPEFKALSLFE